MSNNGKTGLLKFISVLGPKNKESEHQDQSTDRSRTKVHQGHKEHSRDRP